MTMFIIIKAHISFISTAVILFKRGSKGRTISATVQSTSARFGWLFTKQAANASVENGIANFVSGTAAAGLPAAFGLNYIYLAQT